MPKATIEFDLPQEQHEHLTAVHAGELLQAMTEIRQQLRSHQKHDADPVVVLDRIRETISTVSASTGLDI
jgi:hypothetical protein